MFVDMGRSPRSKLISGNSSSYHLDAFKCGQQVEGGGARAKAAKSKWLWLMRLICVDLKKEDKYLLTPHTTETTVYLRVSVSPKITPTLTSPS